MIPTFAIHRDPNIYPEPDLFNPDRILGEKHHFHYLPFGEGPRHCIGLRFGMMQARIGIVTALSNFKFSPTEKTPKTLEFGLNAPILTVRGGVHLKVENL